MITIFRTLVFGIFRDIHTLFWTIAFPLALLAGLGIYLDDAAYTERLLAGVLTMNVLFGATMVTAFYVMAHRNRGIYKLLRATPFSIAAFIGAMTGARTALTLVVSCCIVTMAVLMLGVTLSVANAGLMFLVLLVGTVCFTAIGYIAANLSRDEGNVNMISNLMSFPMLFTSEAFFRLDGAPEWVRIIASLQPFHYFVKAMGAAIHASAASALVWEPLAILAGFTVLCMTIAILTFRWDAEQAGVRRKRRTHAVSS
ncbi:ABC transporter permease [Paenibacillus thiaminolyticus]|uniref:ABC transporter permease n=1 Tax=Paenibacillus thiaminolyticus TaxID=49283 RepID=UPI003D2B04D0